MKNLSMETVLVFVMIIAAFALCYAATLYGSVKKENPGNQTMQDLASYIREGAMAFLTREYKVIIIFAIAVAVLLTALGFITSLQGIDGVGWSGAICFLIGALFSGMAGFIGMKAATLANARTAEAARTGGTLRHCTSHLTAALFWVFPLSVLVCLA